MLDVIEQIYVAGCDPSQWHSLVEHVHASVPGVCCGTHLHLEGTTLGEHSAFAGYAEEHLQSYLAHYPFLNPYVELFERMAPCEVHTIGDVVDREWIKQQVFYHEWLRPAGNLTHGSGLVVLRDEKRLLRLILDIPEELGHLEQPAAVFLKHLTPHLARAFAVNETFSAVAAKDMALAALLDAVDAPAVLVTNTAKVVAANSGAELLLRSGRLVKSGIDAKLVFRDPGHQALFTRLLASATDAAEPGAPVAFRVYLPDGRPRHVMVLPLRMNASLAQARVRAWTLVIFRDPNARQGLFEEAIKSLYGLTKTETAIAVDLTLGLTSDEIAERHRVSKLTVRNQITAAMAKVGVRRQAHLVSTLLALQPRLGGNNHNGD